MDNELKLGERIKEVRKKRRLTQEELAKKLNVSDATINRYEKNKRIPDLNMLLQLAEILDTSIDFLLGRDNVLKSGYNFLEQNGVDRDSNFSRLCEELRARKDLQQLIRQVQDLPSDEISKIIKIIKLIEDK